MENECYFGTGVNKTYVQSTGLWYVDKHTLWSTLTETSDKVLKLYFSLSSGFAFLLSHVTDEKIWRVPGSSEINPAFSLCKAVTYIA